MAGVCQLKKYKQDVDVVKESVDADKQTDCNITTKKRKQVGNPKHTSIGRSFLKTEAKLRQPQAFNKNAETLAHASIDWRCC